MKQFLKLIALILVVSYSLDKLVFYSLNTISDQVMTGQAIGKLNQFLSIKDTTDILIFGNSRANHHINGSVFGESSYNMGTDGIGIDYSSTLINTLPVSKKQVIIVHIDTRNFFDNSYKRTDIRGLKSKYNRNRNITAALDKSNELSFLQNIFYSMNYNGSTIGIIKIFFKPNYNYVSYNGFNPLNVSKSKESKRDIVLSQQKIAACSDSMSINLVAMQYLENIVSFTKKTNKTFLFITSPIHEDTCATDNKILSKIMDSNNLTYWDFTNI